MESFDGGRGIISDTLGYTETHLINVIAYDAAGNKTETEKVRIYVQHQKKKEAKKTSAVLPDWQFWAWRRADT